MQCPVCDERLREVEKMGVIAEICPSCKGAWLERKSLEALFSMTSDAPVSRPVEPPRHQESQRVYEERPYRGDEHGQKRRDHSDDDHHGNSGGQYGGHKKKGLLQNMMDMFGD